MIYNIKRDHQVIVSVKAQGTQNRQIMTQDNVSLSFSLPDALEFKKGDTVEVYGQSYKLNRPNQISQKNDVQGFNYQIEFEALYYDLGKWVLKTLDQNNQLRQAEVYVMSRAEVIIDLIVKNANDNSSGWSIGQIDKTDVMQHGYSSTTLLAVLQDLANKYDNEFWFDGPDNKRINFTKKQINSGITFQFGSNKGLYEISRSKSDKPYFNRLIILGGEKNLPLNYGFSNLQIPSKDRPYLQADTDGFDLVEHTVTYQNIYPTRIGNVSGLAGSLEVYDHTLDFDLNDNLTANPAKIAFISGQLAGFTFSINNYSHRHKKISFNVINDDPAYPIGVPNAYLKAAIGDQYVLLDIFLPQAYVQAAENKLLNIGQQLIKEGAKDQYVYNVSLAPKWILENNFEPLLGEEVKILNTQMGINEDLRLIGFSRDLQRKEILKPTFAQKAPVSEVFKALYTQDKINQGVSKSGLNASGRLGIDTLDSVAKRGKTTAQILHPRGIVISDIFTPPPIAPSLSEMELGRNYFYIQDSLEEPNEFAEYGGKSTTETHIEDLTKQVSTEQSERIQADKALTQQITTEKAERIQVDKALERKILLPKKPQGNRPTRV